MNENYTVLPAEGIVESVLLDWRRTPVRIIAARQMGAQSVCCQLSISAKLRSGRELLHILCSMDAGAR